MDGMTTGGALDPNIRRGPKGEHIYNGVRYALGWDVERSDDRALKEWDIAVDMGSVDAMILIALNNVLMGDEAGQDILSNLAGRGHQLAMFLSGINLAYRAEDVSGLAEGLELINGSDRTGYSTDMYLYENSKGYLGYLRGEPMTGDLYEALLKWIVMPATERVRYGNEAVRNYDPRKGSRIKSEPLHNHWIHERAEQGDTAAEAEYGSICSKNGYHSDAAFWWGRASRKGSAKGMMMLGNAYLHGVGVELSEKKGLELLEQAEEIGCAEASYRLAMYYHDSSNAGSVELYYEYLNKAASKGHPESCFILGRCYLEGEAEGGKCYAKAMSYFERAYTRHAGCMYHLGIMYSNDLGCRNRRTQGQQFMDRAVRKGYNPSSTPA